MQAIIVNKPGKSDVLTLVTKEIPVLKPHEVLVRTKVVGINFIDIYIRNGLYKHGNYPYTPGKEGSGVIEAVGEKVKDLQPGNRVAFCTSGSGTYAEYIALPADEAVIIPEGISYEIAAAAMLQGLTALYLTHLTYPLKAKQFSLIHAGAGGVGTLLIQMAKSIGAKVITTVSTDDKAKLVHELGAEHVVVYTRDSFLEQVLKITQQQGVSVVYDAVGKTTFDDSLKCLTVRGMLVTYGQASGPVPPFDLLKLSEKSLYITRPKLFDYTRTKRELNDLATQLFRMILDKKIKIMIGQTYPLDEAANAQADLESRRTTGKSLLMVG